MTTQPMDELCALLEDDLLTPEARVAFRERHHLSRAMVNDMEGRARSALHLTDKRAEWLGKVEATRSKAMLEASFTAAVACLKLEGEANGWIGSASRRGPPEQAADGKDEKTVWREALLQCPPDVLQEAVERQLTGVH